MPKKVDPKVKERCVQQLLEPSRGTRRRRRPLPGATGVAQESVRRWYVQIQVDRGERRSATSEELAETPDLKDKGRKLEEDNDIVRRASILLQGVRP